MTASRTNSLTVAAMLLFAASGCSKKPAPENQTAAPSPAPVLPDEHTLKDTDITAATEASLARDPGVHANDVHVKTTDGIVELTGKAKDLLTKQRATMLAEGVKGVRAVSNRIELDVKNVPHAEIENSVRDTLLYNPVTKSFEVDVKANNGIVTLNLNVVPEKPVPDDLLKRRVQNAYLYDPLTNAYQIDVKADHGVVTLAGKVDNAFERAEAMQLAARMDGVKRVNNQLDVKHPEIPYVYNWYVAPYEPIVELWYYAPSTTIQTDADIRKHIETELTWSPFVNEQQVHVDVVGGKATLTGTVDSTAERVAAVGDAFEGGAITVDDRLKVKAPGS